MKELCPAEALHEECGVFGIYDSTGKTNMVSAVYSALYALQHRGQESCGIALNVDGVLTGYRDLGLVSEVFTPRVLADLPQDAKMATGHVRYATSGQRTRANAQPMVLHHCKGAMAICHNGNLTNAPQLRHKLEMNGSIFHGTSDTEVIGYLLTQNRLISPDIETAVCRTMESSTSTTRLPATVEEIAFNLMRTLLSRWAWDPWMKVRPTYLFLIKPTP